MATLQQLVTWIQNQPAPQGPVYQTLLAQFVLDYEEFGVGSGSATYSGSVGLPRPYLLKGILQNPQSSGSLCAFDIITNNPANAIDLNVYLVGVDFNGLLIAGPDVSYDDITRGGVLSFQYNLSTVGEEGTLLKCSLTLIETHGGAKPSGAESGEIRRGKPAAIGKGKSAGSGR